MQTLVLQRLIFQKHIIFLNYLYNDYSQMITWKRMFNFLINT